MPEIPELEVTLRRIDGWVGGRELSAVELGTPFFLRTAEVPLDELIGLELQQACRRGKHLALAFGDEGEARRWLVIHLMLAGRLDGRPSGKALPRRDGLLKLSFGDRALVVTERSRKKGAALYAVRQLDEVPRLRELPTDPLDPAFDRDALAAALSQRSSQLKNALTDWRRVGLGNAYADEVLWAARLSPLRLTGQLDDPAIDRLHVAIGEQLARWIDEVDRLAGAGFPTHQPTWRKTLAIHGQAGQPCPACGETIAAVRYAERETCYCPTCQTGGKPLADRRRSRFLK